MTYPDPQVAARRSLIHRIRRFTDRICRDGVQPDRDALDNLMLAVECLEAGNYPGGEDAMFLAEKGWAPRFPRTGQTRQFSEMVAHLESLVAQG